MGLDLDFLGLGGRGGGGGRDDEGVGGEVWVGRVGWGGEVEAEFADQAVEDVDVDAAEDDEEEGRDRGADYAADGAEGAEAVAYGGCGGGYD